MNLRRIQLNNWFIAANCILVLVLSHSCLSAPTKDDEYTIRDTRPNASCPDGFIRNFLTELCVIPVGEPCKHMKDLNKTAEPCGPDSACDIKENFCRCAQRTHPLQDLSGCGSIENIRGYSERRFGYGGCCRGGLVATSLLWRPIYPHYPHSHYRPYRHRCTATSYVRCSASTNNLHVSGNQQHILMSLVFSFLATISSTSAMIS